MNTRIILIGIFCLSAASITHAETCTDRVSASGILTNTFTSGTLGGTATFRARAAARDGQLSGSFDLTDTSGIVIRSTRITRYFFNSETSRAAEYESVINGTNNGFVIVNFFDNGDTGDVFDVQVLASGVSYGAAGPVNDGSVVIEPAVDCTSCITAPFFIAGWWTGDHNGQDIWSTNDARLENGTKTVHGFVDKAFSFDGVDDFAAVPASSGTDIATSGSFTIEAWINPAAITGRQTLAAWRSDNGDLGVGLYLEQNGSLYANFASNSSFSISSNPGTITAGAWQHVAFTWSSSSRRATLYANGNFVAIQSYTNLVPNTSGALHLGGLPTGNNYQGLIDELTTYTRDHVPGVIQSIYQAGASGKCKPQ
jgi:hypothetical protein